MDHVIVADEDGKELRVLLFTEYDFEVGKEDNSFELVIRREEYETIPDKARIYIPGTEYGGIFRKIKTNTKTDTISPGGLTWRGMMQKKVIEPPSGEDYATDTGELNAIVKAKVETAFPGLFIGSDVSTGVSVTNFQYDRYCTMEEGLSKLLSSKGYRLKIEYSQTEKAVIVSAVPVIDYSEQIEFSSDMRLNYIMEMQTDGVNHLICLGTGELRDRIVYHMYVDQNGDIGTTQYYTGVDEVAEIFDYTGAELSDLLQAGKRRLEEVMSKNVFEITVEPDMEISVGDIVGGRDYLTGMTVKAPITGKVVKWKNGFRTIEYRLKNENDS